MTYYDRRDSFLAMNNISTNFLETEEFLTPEEYLNALKDKKHFKEAVIVPPNFGRADFGKIKVPRQNLFAKIPHGRRRK